LTIITYKKVIENMTSPFPHSEYVHLSTVREVTDIKSKLGKEKVPVIMSGLNSWWVFSF